MNLFRLRGDPLVQAVGQCRLTLETPLAPTIPGAPAGLAVRVTNHSRASLGGRRDAWPRLLTVGARIKRVEDGAGAWVEVGERGFLDADLAPGASMVAGMRLTAPSEGRYALLVSAVLEGVAWQVDVPGSSRVETPLEVVPPGSAAILNLGCGARPLAGAVNLDRAHMPGVDVEADLDDVPWPFTEAQFSEVLAFDVFEHVEDPLAFMAEAHRILRPGGLLKVHTSYWKTGGSFSDPTHRRFCTPTTFDYWVPGTSQHQRYPHYSGGRAFGKRVVAIDGEELYFELQKLPG